MSIPMNETCFKCRIDRITCRIAPMGTPEQTRAFLRRWMGMASQYQDFVDSARCGAYTDKIVKETYGRNCADIMAEDRKRSNAFVVERLDAIRSRVAAEKDPVYAGLQYAVLGNYLDFATLGDKIDFKNFDTMLDKARDMDLDKAAVAEFAADLEKGKKLLILTDNAGEIGFDRVLAEVLQQQYPHLEITFCVRGFPVANDATREDAQAVGITFPIIDSGNAVGGTAEELLSPEAKKALDEADVILAKGMGNTESMWGCGRNIYYAFLIKCQRFVEVFNAPMMQAMFLKDKGEQVR